MDTLQHATTENEMLIERFNGQRDSAGREGKLSRQVLAGKRVSMHFPHLAAILIEGLAVNGRPGERVVARRGGQAGQSASAPRGVG